MDKLHADALKLDDIDPKLASLTREKTMSVLSSLGFEGALATLRERRVSEQTAARKGELPIISVHDHERAELAIRTYVREDANTRLGRFANFCSWLIGLIIFGFIIANIILLSTDHNADLLLVNFAVCSALIAAMYPLKLAKRRRRNIPLSVAANVLPCVANSPGEQAYSAAVSEVVNAKVVLGIEESRAMIASLNSLLESERLVTAQREAISRAMHTQTIPSLQAERDRLQERLDTTEDAIARQTMAESLQMCDSRLERARQMAPIRERIEAQQESIRQTMASVQTSLASLAIASMETFSSVEMVGPRAALLQTTRDLQNRATAVEKAVQEVATLRVG